MSAAVSYDSSWSLVEFRSRYAKFINDRCVIHKPVHVLRDREPSRIPVKQLTRVMNKSRTIRRIVRKDIDKKCTKVI